jgi:eukaryotic-like serine/threonine-protein kinase
VTPIDEDPPKPGASPQVLTFGAPQLGEVLAERYRLEEHIGDDSLGRQLWRGSDVILQRPVTVVLRYPGGDSAAEMLSAAVAASRIVHPHLVGVYDAIDEADRAYVVREWVQGTSLRNVVEEYGPLEADKAIAIGHAISDAIAALHATGMAHGNVQPGTVLIGDDGRVVLADARADESATQEFDIKTIGAVLYCALTGHWPHAEAGVSLVPDAVRDSAGNLAAPHQVRAGVPDQLDELTVTLLSRDLTPPTADEVTGELARLDSAEDHRALFADEPLDLDAFDQAAGAPESSRPTGRKMAIVVAALVIIAAVGTIAAARTLGGNSPSDSPRASASGAAASGPAPTGEAAPIKLKPEQVRIVDPKGNGTERRDNKNLVDGDPKTSWRTDRYPSANFGGGLKDGMGVLIDLGKETSVTAVEITFKEPGATVELRGVASDPGASNSGDAALVGASTVIGAPKPEATSRTVLPGGPDQKVRYLLVWVTKLPKDSSGGFRVEIQEISVRGS